MRKREVWMLDQGDFIGNSFRMQIQSYTFTQNQEIMKAIIHPLFFLALFLISSCGGSSTKRLARGSFDSAINKSVRKLQKDPGDLAELEVLRKAYDENLVQANETIARLKAQNNGEALMSVVAEYKRLDRISNQINALPSSISSQFSLKNYTSEIQNFTTQASNKMFDEAEALFNSPVKEDQRLACEKFRRIKQVNPQFPEINRWIEEAEEQAITKILVDIEDKTPYKFRDTLMTYIQKKKMSELNSGEWQRYSLYKSGNFDGRVKINIQKIGVEKNTTNSNTHNYEKELQIPEYVLDANGNVKKDADGNDMKTFKTKKVKATVIQEDINYDAVMRGSVSYFDYYRNADIESEEIDQKKTITRTNYQVSGDQEALDDALLAKIEQSKGQKEPSEKELVRLQMKDWRDYIYKKIRDSKRMW